MSPLILARLKMVKNTILGIRDEPLAKITFISITTLILISGVFVGLYMGLRYLDRSSPFGPFMLERVISFYFMILFGMLILSNLVTGYSILYRSQESEYLFSLPLSHTQIFTIHFLTTLFLASWPFLLLALPLIISYGLVKGEPLYFYPLSFLLFPPFIIIPAGIGVISAVILRRVVIVGGRRDILLSIMVILLPFVYLFFSMSWGIQGKGDSYRFLQALFERIAFSSSPLLPSRWLALGTELLGRGDLYGWGYYLLLILSNGLMAFLLVVSISSRLYYQGWCEPEGVFYFYKVKIGGGLSRWLTRFFPKWIRALAEKDIKCFLRDPSQWAHFLIFLGLIIVYVSNLRDMEEGIYTPFWKVTILLINLGGIGFILATLTTRFIFPLFSLEGMRFWIIGLAPISLKRIVIQKFFLSLCLCGGVTFLLIPISNLILKTKPFPFIVTSITIIVMSVTMAGLSVGLGTVFANIKAESPARVVSGIGGTLNAIISLLYVGIVVLAEAIPLFLYTFGRIQPDTYYVLWGLAIFFVVMMSLCLLILPLKAGFRATERMEF